VLFLVDRLELEDQAKKAFAAVLSADFQTVIYKENRDDWRRAEIVVTTVQSLLFNNKYQRLFSPTDFDLVISDEAHRSIGGNARAVFDYFIGYKLGLTATPRDYLKKFDRASPARRDPREAERRLLLDTYRTFGCENGQPTFRYSLLDGVKEGYLINPTVVDARTEITTSCFPTEGFVVVVPSPTTPARTSRRPSSARVREAFLLPATNQLFCKTFLENALRDPVSGEIRQVHRLRRQPEPRRQAGPDPQRTWPTASGRANTSPTSPCRSPPRSRRPAIHHQLHQQQPARLGQLPPRLQDQQGAHLRHRRHDDHRLRLPDILNLGLFRPIFSPTDFIQIKGRGTRKHDFREQLFDATLKDGRGNSPSRRLQALRLLRQLRILRGEFNYDEVLKLPPPQGKGGEAGAGTAKARVVGGTYEHLGADILASMRVEQITGRGHEDRPHVLRAFRRRDPRR
jgi:type I restriction enzyme R subunit